MAATEFDDNNNRFYAKCVFESEMSCVTYLREESIRQWDDSGISNEKGCKDARY